MIINILYGLFIAALCYLGLVHSLKWYITNDKKELFILLFVFSGIAFVTTVLNKFVTTLETEGITIVSTGIILFLVALEVLFNSKPKETPPV